jgi:hypothetical protein
MITGDQILCHLLGDYLLQSDWMATEKTKRHLAAWLHALCYSLPFLFLRPSSRALAVIIVTHALIDRYRLARYVVWWKNFLAPVHYSNVDSRFESVNFPWYPCRETGYPKGHPTWLTVWLLIIADNTIHLLVNGLALRCLRWKA